MLVLTPKAKLTEMERFVLNQNHAFCPVRAKPIPADNWYTTPKPEPMVLNARVDSQSSWLSNPYTGILGTRKEKPVVKQYGICSICESVYGFNYSQTKVYLVPLKWFARKKNGKVALQGVVLALCEGCAANFGLPEIYLFRTFLDNTQSYTEYHNQMAERVRQLNEGTLGFPMNPGVLVGYSFTAEVDIPGKKSLSRKVFEAGLVECQLGALAVGVTAASANTQN